MKILHIIDSGGLYGAEIMVLNLVEEQVRMGLDPSICSIGENGIDEKPIESEAVKRGIKMKKFRMASGPNLIGAFKILRYAKKERFDILHSHGYKGNILFGFMPKVIRGLPLVTTIHGWTSTAISGFSKMKLYEWLDAQSFKRIDKIILVNKRMLLNPKLKTANLQNLTVINNGIPQITGIDYSDDLDKDIVDFCKEGFIVGAIGRLSTEKGFDYLIAAVAGLSSEIPNIKLVIIGEGGERRFLEKMVSELGLDGKVTMPGYKESAHRYLPLFSVFVISSLTEGLPISLLEAMQYGIPIVATEVGGIPDVLHNGEAGILIQPGDGTLIAKSLRRVYERQSDLVTMVGKAKDRVLSDYSVSKMASEYNALYKVVIKEMLAKGKLPKEGFGRGIRN